MARRLLSLRRMEAELQPELDEEWRALFERFLQSEECAAAACGSAPWTLSFLDSLRVLECPMGALDMAALTAALFDGMGWTIAAPPENPAAVARELHALLRWAVRVGEAEPSPEYQECLAYLATAEAVTDIERWLTPIGFLELDLPGLGREPGATQSARAPRFWS